MRVETLFGDVYISDLSSGRKAVKVVGAVTTEHALSVASQAVNEVGLDGEWADHVVTTPEAYVFVLNPIEPTCAGDPPDWL